MVSLLSLKNHHQLLWSTVLQTWIQTSHERAKNGAEREPAIAGSKTKLENQEYFTFAKVAQLMGVTRQYIYKLVKEDKLRASRISTRMSIIRRSDLELMLKSKPYERVMQKTIMMLLTTTPLSRLLKNTKSSRNGSGPTPEKTTFPR